MALTKQLGNKCLNHTQSGGSQTSGAWLQVSSCESVICGRTPSSACTRTQPLELGWRLSREDSSKVSHFSAARWSGFHQHDCSNLTEFLKLVENVRNQSWNIITLKYVPVLNCLYRSLEQPATSARHFNQISEIRLNESSCGPSAKSFSFTLEKRQSDSRQICLAFLNMEI